MNETMLATAVLALLLSLLALRRAARVEAALAAEKVERLSGSEASSASVRLTTSRIDAVEQRVGRGRRVTPAKRDRALDLLARGASEAAIARELELRQAEVHVLAQLRNLVP